MIHFAKRADAYQALLQASYKLLPVQGADLTKVLESNFYWRDCYKNNGGDMCHDENFISSSFLNGQFFFFSHIHESRS